MYVYTSMTYAQVDYCVCIHLNDLCSGRLLCMYVYVVSNRSPAVYFLTASLAWALNRDGHLLMNFQHLRWASKQNGCLFGEGTYSREYGMCPQCSLSLHVSCSCMVLLL